MTTKICTAVLSLLMVTSAANATITAKSATSARATKVAAEPSKAVEEARREYIAKGGRINEMSHKVKAAFLLAVKSYSDKTPGLSSNSLMRLLLAPELTYLQGKGIEEQVQILAKMKASGTKEEKEAADVKLELMELAGIRMDAKNMTSKEFEALRVLLSIDVQAVPEAVPVMGKIVSNLRSGSMSLEAAVTKAMEGMDGFLQAKSMTEFLEQFLRLCGGKNA